MSYLVINEKTCDLFIDRKKVDDKMFDYFKSINVNIHSYGEINSFIDKYRGIIMLDYKKVNYSIFSSIKCEIINVVNPSILMKSIKNQIEIDNLKKVHIKDGVAVTKFMYWLKTNIGSLEISEISAQNYLYKLRENIDSYIEPSFDTISAYKANAAMMHYSASTKTNSLLLPEGLLLVDSGGHYYEGTTDITRTFGLGKITNEERDYFTLVLQSVLNLAHIKFLKGCTGLNLDILARGPIWNNLVDYKCGTGHGVGYLLSVHEAPNGFRWKVVPERNDSTAFIPGMVTTNEPGIYLEGKFGIRIEQELLCVEVANNDFGTFYGFDYLTYVPIDLDCINPKLLTPEAILNLNKYHEDVYNKISPYLTNNEAKWLKKYTRNI